MSEPVDKSLYSRVKSRANKKFSSKTGIYKSSWIVKEYKRLGGKYRGKKPSVKSPGLKRWYKEKWVDLNRPIKNSSGKVIGYKSCGRSSIKTKRYPLCRPSKRVTSGTPRTFKEISKSKIRRAKREKSRVRGSKNIKFPESLIFEYVSKEISLNTGLIIVPSSSFSKKFISSHMFSMNSFLSESFNSNPTYDERLTANSDRFDLRLFRLL